MRLVIRLLIAAILLVTLTDARSSSPSQHKDVQHHVQQQHRHHQSTRQGKQLKAKKHLSERLSHQSNTWTNTSTMAVRERGPKLSKKLQLKLNNLHKIMRDDERKSSQYWSRTSAAADDDSRGIRAHNSKASLQCCPTVVDVVQPRGAVNMDGHLVELHRPANVNQRIFEHSCRPDVLNKPCRFIEKLLKPISKCVQQYSYAYALVRKHSDASAWAMDYIRIRSGCSCEMNIDD